MSQLSDSLASARARRDAGRSPAGSSPRFGAMARSGFLTPRVATPVILERGLEGLGEFSLSVSGGGVAVTSVFLMTTELQAELCCGVIKGSTRMCTLGRTSCTAKTHVLKKLSVPVDHLLIVGARNSAHATPTLAASKLSESQLRRFLREQHSVQEWSRLFHIMDGYDERLEEEEADAVIKQVTEGGESTAIGKTPKRRRINFGEDELGGAAFGSLKEFALTPLGSLSEEDDQLSRVLSQWDMLVGQVSNLSKAEDSTKQLICAELNEFSIQLRSLEASIGRDTSVDPSSNVWSGLAELREEVKDHDELIGNLADELGVAQADIEIITDENRRTDVEFEGIKQVQGELAELTSLINSEQEAISKDMEGLKKLASGASVGTSVGRAGGAATSAATASLWKRELELLRSLVTSSESEIGLRMNALETAVGSRLEELARKVDARMSATSSGSGSGAGVIEEVKWMKEKLKILEARVSSKPVVLGGRVFSSFPDVHKFVVDNVPPNIYFLFS